MKTFILELLLLLAAIDVVNGQNANFTLRSNFQFPAEPIAGVWGYEQNGHEFALVAGRQNLHIVDVTKPDTPILIISLPMASDWGKEVRTFQQFAFVSSESGAGLVVYDLSQLPSTNPDHYPKKEIAKAGGYNTYGHTLHIDTAAAVLYLNDGGSSHSWVFSLLPAPFSPDFMGFYQILGGIHDGYADNDTLFAAHIFSGFVAVVDMHNKLNPIVLSTFETPGKFPHNTWLMKARNHLLVADEVSNGFVSVWDLSNLDDVRQTSRFRPKGLSGSIPHNAFILDNYAFVSWYRDGVMMLDLNRPENIVQVGQFDTSPLSGNGFNGSWGNYPYLKSGNILVSDIENGLFVFTPTYVRACYLEGSVKDARTKKPVVGAVVYILQGDQADMPVTSTQGNYQTGQALSGKFRVLIYHEDYRPGLQTVQLKNGEVTMLNIELTPLSEPGEEVSLLLLKAEDHQPLSGMEFVVRNEIFQFICRTDAKGWAKIPIVYADTFDLFPSTWGRMPLKNVIIDPVQLHPLMLDRGYYDDFYFNFGWISGGDANGGFWERGKLQKYQSFIPAPNTDISNDLGDTCFLTDHRISYGDIWFDVTGGTVSLTSPPVDLQNFKYPVLQFQYWLTISDTSSQFFVSLENTQTGIKKKVWESNANVLFWTSSGAIPLPAITKEGIWNIVFEARDTTTGLGQGLLEVGIDEIIIREAEPLAPYPIENFSADVFPNPFYDHLILRCFLPEKQIPAEWHLFNAVGSLVMSGNIRNSISVLTLTPGISSGVYFLSIQQAGRVLKTIKIIHY